ncbi:MAG: hypothetical protein GY835_02850 [bacterium]|nr:hypothetical protein [bacterium]
MKTPKIPDTDSIAELAAFWDNHDLTDFEEELEEVTHPVFKRRSASDVKIRLSSAEVAAAEQIAKAQGVGLAVLIRDWVVERLKQASPTHESRPPTGQLHSPG